MTASTFPGHIHHPRLAWRGLLWTGAATLSWTLLIALFPAISESGVPTATARLMTYAVLGLGLWLALERTDRSPAQRRASWMAIMIAWTLWFALAWSAAIAGVFRMGASRLPALPMAIILPVVIGAPLLLASRRVGALLDATPPAWLVGLQAYRVFGSVWLVGGLQGALPALFGVPAGLGDILTGVFAVPTAIALAEGTGWARRGAIAWNLLGLADFVVAITLGLITSPGPLQLIVPDVASVGAGAYPGVLTPAFVVPSSILLHALSLRQLYRQRRAAAANAGAGTPASSRSIGGLDQETRA